MIDFISDGPCSDEEFGMPYEAVKKHFAEFMAKQTGWRSWSSIFTRMAGIRICTYCTREDAGSITLSRITWQMPWNQMSWNKNSKKGRGWFQCTNKLFQDAGADRKRDAAVPVFMI